MKLSKMSHDLQSSPIRKFIPYANQAKAEGVNVYHLNIGQPDIKTPVEFYDAIKNFDEETISYADSRGILELREAIAKYYDRFNLGFTKDDILINSGGSEAIQIVMFLICDKDSEIIAPEPFYTNYNSFVTMANAKIRPVTANAEDGFSLPAKCEFEKVINENTRAIMITSPSNPTGAIYTKEELEMIKDLALEHDLFIISDEVYREFAYDGKEAISMGSFKEIEDRVIIVDSISKRYSACGARIGNIACKNKEFMAAALKFAQARLSCPTLEQIAAVELYNMDEKYFDEVLKEYEHRRNVLYDGLMSIEGITCKKPNGAFYMVVDLPVDDAEDFVIFLLEKFRDKNETIMITPAEGFYKTEGLGKNQVRITYTLEAKKLERAIEILDKALKEYNK